MDEFELKALLAEKRKEIKTFDDLIAFLTEIKDNYSNCGYGETIRAIGQAITATAFYFGDIMGTTGFQASCIMWDFIRNYIYPHNKCGMRLMDYDKMLYPQYGYQFDKTIPQSTWEELQKTAIENLEDNEYAAPAVRKHWQSIADGIVPFGYIVKDN